MTPVDTLAAPLRVLLDTVGSAALPTPGPTSAIRESAATLDSADARLQHAVEALLRDWQSTAADDAQRAIRTHRQQTVRASDDGSTIASVIDDAAVTIRHAATELRAILDSFVAAANALGPGLYTPAGLAAIIPAAADHLQRALAVVERTRAQLDHQARRLMALGRHPAPGVPGDAAAIRNRISSALGDLGRAVQPHTASMSSTAPSSTTPSSTGAAQTHSSSVDGAGENASTTAAGKPGGPPTPGAVPITLPDGSVAYAPNQRAATAVRAALSQRGVPYVWGGTAPGSGLDCSGLTQYAYRQAGVELPRLAQDQDTAGFRVDRAELLPGDLAVWSGHVAMYIGNNQMVEAGGDPVQVSPLRTTNLDQIFEGFYRPR